MECPLRGLADIQRLIDEVTRFLSATLGVANAHTVEFYTHDVWSQFMSVRPEEVLSAVSDHTRVPEHNTNGKCQSVLLPVLHISSEFKCITESTQVYNFEYHFNCTFHDYIMIMII